MVTVGLWVRLEAKPGREDDVSAFLVGARDIVDAEPGTEAWFALRLGPTTFGIFDAFPDDAARDEHLAGRVAAALGEKATDLLAEAPAIEKLDVLASKLP
ncbi:antibiotic biosynthesis monooxygenase [Conexibacter sp. JD483]|uniref:putative quinol monooxygenase n=1 Tax=unclassified Conexibacter TaxID=2627773 RepID=UPI002728B1A1|nr:MULTISPECIES: antibiotic biosynthesis monooxygenase [unclassified Conexibacter]MDO8187988.1 antibiotic biosynthesis monooxygenase [Conexibacter sp. CPCC 205706]MDO8200871.1 antibiotic biosynthesis monooxygenase [Conexibacter sp. CPCC 205762]MDR9370396.1 antibiotic biosynthesis monooxygenase [Conexibacter sp. JD483]